MTTTREEKLLTPGERFRDRVMACAESLRSPCAITPADYPVAIQKLENFYGALSGYELLRPLRENIRRISNRMKWVRKEKLNVAVIGEFSAGKSSLINAMLGGENFLPVDISETTALVSALEYSEKPGVRIHFENETSRESSFPEYANLVNEQVDSEIRHQVKYVTVYANYPPLEQITIYDTPGLNSRNDRHEQTTLDYIRQVQIVFWVFRADKITSGTEVDYLGRIRSHGCRVYGIINKIDTIRGFRNNPERYTSELKRVLEAAHRHCGKVIERFIPLSARLIADALRTGNHADLQASNYAEFKSCVEEEIARNTKTLKENYIRGVLEISRGLGVAFDKCLSEEWAATISALDSLKGDLVRICKEMETEQMHQRRSVRPGPASFLNHKK